MMTGMVAAITIARLMVPIPGAAPDPCRLLTAGEIKSALGSAPEGGKPDGPTIDKELQGTTWTCNQQVGKDLLSITFFEFASAAAAARGMTEVMKLAQEIPDGIKLMAASGVGDRALWGAEEGGAMWVALKGKYMLSVTLAGEVADPPRLREPLKRLTTLALGRLVS